MDDMVRLCFEDAGRLSLNFNENEGQQNKGNSRLIKAREVKIVKNGKQTFHAKQFYDSANPKNNKSILIKKTEKEKNKENNEQ